MKLDPFSEAAKAFSRFCETIAALRHPTSGCPWDLEQTHDSLRRYMIEEAYEAAHAMKVGPAKDICEELGDVLLQVVLNAQVAADSESFNISEVIDAIDKKMRRRHPHVFQTGVKAETSAEVRANWDVIKSQEKNKPAAKEAFFAACEKIQPATLQALAIGKQAAKIKFDWEKVEDVRLKFVSEVEELNEALRNSSGKASAAVYSEIGDLYFSLAQLCRHLGIDPEVAAIDGNEKFMSRFKLLESLATKPLSGLTQQELEALWSKAKSLE